MTITAEYGISSDARGSFTIPCTFPDNPKIEAEYRNRQVVVEFHRRRAPRVDGRPLPKGALSYVKSIANL